MNNDNHKFTNRIPNRAKKSFALFLFLLLAVPTFPQSDEDCLSCHSDEELTTERDEKTISLFVNEAHLKNSAHKKLKCISCHTGFNAEEIPHKETIEPINCMTCHKDAGVKHPFHPRMLKQKGSEVGKDVNCKSCHGTHKVELTQSENSKFHEKNLTETCGSCHSKQKEEYLLSEHGKLNGDKVANTPTCISCHKSGAITREFSKDIVKTKLKQETMCLSCHLDNPEVKARMMPTTGFIKAYETSVHGKALLGGNEKAPNCVDCHSSHKVLKGSDPQSGVAKKNIPATCAACHEEITKDYRESVHGIALARKNSDSPACTDCHGEHNILKHSDPKSPVAFQNVSEQVCSPCHSSVKLSEKYGLNANRFQTFKDTYHGLALRGGSAEVANCASCHGVHNIKSSSDSTSTIHKANLVKTCGKCHPGANDNFTIGSVHVTLEEADEPLLYWVATIYLIIIGVTIGGMLFHNFVDFLRKGYNKQLVRRGKIREEKHGHSLYLRMSLNERIQHITLVVSFFTLVITGFMLRFPDAWWVRHIRDFSEYAFEIRSLLHRIAAVIMVAVSVYHIFYLTFNERGKRLLKDMLPKFSDVTDAIGVMKYNLGISSVKPKLDRFSYIEKAEYWALVWGTIVMTATGFILWFDNTFMGLLSKLGWDVARTIHYYEAWLAFLAIIVWHFYFVVFNPDVYPMNLAWFKGTITEEEMAHEHPKELERIKNIEGEKVSSPQEETDG